jgi:hypothetical protein
MLIALLIQFYKLYLITGAGIAVTAKTTKRVCFGVNLQAGCFVGVEGAMQAVVFVGVQSVMV